MLLRPLRSWRGGRSSALLAIDPLLGSAAVLISLLVSSMGVACVALTGGSASHGASPDGDQDESSDGGEAPEGLAFASPGAAGCGTDPSPSTNDPAGAGAEADVFYCPTCGAAYVDDAGCDYCPGARLARTPPEVWELGEFVMLMSAHSVEEAELRRLELASAAIPVEIRDLSVPIYEALGGSMARRDVRVPVRCLARARELLGIDSTI
jgi:hypothetical protein